MTHKLLPIEPTEEMVLNAINTFGGVMGTPENLANPPDYVIRMLDRQKKAVAGHYKAMLEASPTTDTVTLSRAEHDALVAIEESARNLLAESEEYHFDDGLGKGAVQQYWDGLDCALDQLDEAKDNETKMKLWLLRPIDGLKIDDNPWEPWYDKAFGFVVRAATEEEARALAHAEAGNENRGTFIDRKIANTHQPWMDAKYSTCVELLTEGAPEVVMKDFASA